MNGIILYPASHATGFLLCGNDSSAERRGLVPSLLVLLSALIPVVSLMGLMDDMTCDHSSKCVRSKVAARRPRPIR